MKTWELGSCWGTDGERKVPVSVWNPAGARSHALRAYVCMVILMLESRSSALKEKQERAHLSSVCMYIHAMCGEMEKCSIIASKSSSYVCPKTAIAESAGQPYVSLV